MNGDVEVKNNDGLEQHIPPLEGQCTPCENIEMHIPIGSQSSKGFGIHHK